jgi:hypothetical protein
MGAPSSAATPRPHKAVYYIAGHYIFNPQVYNQFNPGLPGNLAGPSYGGEGAVELPPLPVAGNAVDFMVSAQAHFYEYPHPGPVGPTPSVCGNGNPGCVTNIGGMGQTPVRGFTAQDSDYSVHLGLGAAPGRVYVAGAYMSRQNNYGYPNTQGYGFGLEKLADVDHAIAPYGSIYSYPTLGAGTTLHYSVITYHVGGAVNLAPVRIPSAFLDLGYEGDSGHVRTDFVPVPPSDFQHAGFYAGFGLKF